MYAIFGKNIRNLLSRLLYLSQKTTKDVYKTTRFGKRVREIKDCADGSLSRCCAKGVGVCVLG